MLNSLTLILVCQLAGEMLVTSTGVPLPGPVIGMVLLFVFLVFNQKFSAAPRDASGVPIELAKVSDGLLSHLSLLFVPAGVGVMAHFKLLETDWVPLGAAIIGSTMLTIVVTAGIMIATRKYFPEEIIIVDQEKH